MTREEMIIRFDTQINLRLGWLVDSFIYGTDSEADVRYRHGLYREITAILDMAQELDLLTFEEWSNCYCTLYGENESLDDKCTAEYNTEGFIVTYE